MDKKKLIIVCDGSVTTMDRQSALAMASIHHGECLIFESMEQFASSIDGRFIEALMDASGMNDQLTAAFKELELSLEPEQDFTVSYKDYLGKGKRKNKRAMYKRR